MTSIPLPCSKDSSAELAAGSGQYPFRWPIASGAEPPAQPLVETPQFKAWFRNSLVTTPLGDPLVVYRGEHGECRAGDDFQTREPSLSFSGPETASEYALSPNHRNDVAVHPRVYPCYLRIEHPVLNDESDPFLDFSLLAAQFGEDAARALAIRFDQFVEDTGPWQEELGRKYGTVEHMLRLAPGRIHEIYMLAFPLLADPAFVQLAQAKGYDGAIHGHYGDGGQDEPEYKVFDRCQVQSAIGHTVECRPGHRRMAA